MQNNSEIKFGTDGWRGIISDNFTFTNVRSVAQAIADYYNGLSVSAAPGAAVGIAVGYDTRFLSETYAELVSEVLAVNGIDVTLSDRCVPTPALSFAVRNRNLTAGVMITASHNPKEYNGIKIKTASGGAAGIEVTREVERLISGPAQAHPAQPAGVIRKVDLTKEYVKFLRHYIDFKALKGRKFRVLVDAMHGSGNGFIARVLEGSGIKVEFMRDQINPSFGGVRPEPVLENLKETCLRMKNGRYDLCLVLDGDADRIAAFAGKGEFIYPQKVLGLLILHLIQDRKMTGAVVKTIVGSNLVDRIAGGLGLELHETPVGFKYISELMQKQDILVGGEEAGGMGFKGYIPERDGSLAGLLLLEMMAHRKKPMIKILKEMESKYGRYYYLRDDMRLPVADYKMPDAEIRSQTSLLGRKVVQVKDYDGIKLICDDASWLMFRGSGTEPIMRVYAEARSPAKAKKLLAFGRGLILRDAV